MSRAGGPAGCTTLAIVEARDPEEASALLLDHPWETVGIQIPPEVVPWTIFPDSRPNRG